MNSDFKELLKAFNDCQVKYLVVGGYAVMNYTEPRYTKDLDVWVKADKDNAAAVFKALRVFGAPLLAVTEDDFAQEGYFYQIGVPPVRIDILMSIQGVTFEEAWANRVESDLGGIKAWFISKRDLIVSKRASARPQDIIDSQLLELSDTVESDLKTKSPPRKKR
jgi:hypothetical protein